MFAAVAWLWLGAPERGVTTGRGDGGVVTLAYGGSAAAPPPPARPTLSLEATPPTAHLTSRLAPRGSPRLVSARVVSSRLTLRSLRTTRRAGAQARTT